MSVRTRIAAAAALLAIAGVAATAMAQSPYTSRADNHAGLQPDYSAGLPGPYRPHIALPGKTFGAPRAPARVPGAPLDDEFLRGVNMPLIDH